MPLPDGLAPPSGAALVAMSCPEAGAGLTRALMGEPGGPVTGVAAPPADVGSPLSAATAGWLEESDAPAPGAIWLEELSRLPDDVPCVSNISLSSITTCFALP